MQPADMNPTELGGVEENTSG